jgi:membrane protein YqaA with SNARE-associated domain
MNGSAVDDGDLQGQVGDAAKGLSAQGPTERRVTLQAKRGIWRSILGLVVVLLISASVFVIGNRAQQFARYGYPGIFVISLLASATIVLPAPSLAVVSVMGSVLNPLWVGLSAGAGEALGEMTGYLAGYSGRAVIENRAHYDRMVWWTRKYGLWVILVLSIIPNPFFDLAGIAAGALKIPLVRFVVVCWIGKSIKTVLFALGGKALLWRFLRF